MAVESFLVGAGRSARTKVERRGEFGGGGGGGGGEGEGEGEGEG